MTRSTAANGSSAGVLMKMRPSTVTQTIGFVRFDATGPHGCLSRLGGCPGVVESGVRLLAKVDNAAVLERIDDRTAPKRLRKQARELLQS